ncbi:MAG: (Fe-S)-binding protein [Anaerolineae bacterium]
MSRRDLWSLGGRVLWSLLSGWRGREAHRGLETFLQHYAPDHLTPRTPDEVRLLPAWEACVNCGLCTARCPVLRALLEAEGRYAGPRQVATSLSRTLPEAWAAHDTCYTCTLCGACEAVCPVGVPIPDLVAHLRRAIALQEAQDGAEYVPPAHRALLGGLRERGNIFGQDLAPWPRRGRAEYVFFVGCAFSYWERESIAATMALLQHLGVDFTTVDEVCCGGPAPMAGAPGDVEALAQRNLAAFAAAGTRKVITACPRCALTLSTHPAYRGLEVRHTAQVLAERLDRLPRGFLEQPATFHDPCELARGLGEVKAPRQVLAWAGRDLLEMEACREHTDCCGGGGGVRGAYTRLSLKMARARLEAAMATGAEVLLTECPTCLHNFRNARRSRDAVEVYDLSEYLALCLGLAQRGEPNPFLSP